MPDEPRSGWQRFVDKLTHSTPTRVKLWRMQGEIDELWEQLELVHDRIRRRDNREYARSARARQSGQTLDGAGGDAPSSDRGSTPAAALATGGAMAPEEKRALRSRAKAVGLLR